MVNGKGKCRIPADLQVHRESQRTKVWGGIALIVIVAVGAFIITAVSIP